MDEDNLDEEFSIMYKEPGRIKTLNSDSFRVPIKNLKLRMPVSLSGEQSVQEAITLMQSNHFGCVVVTKDSKLVGIVTEHDIIAKALAERKDVSKTKIKEIMTPDPESLQPDDSLGAVMNAMHVGGYRHVPVVDEQNIPLAVVSVKDVIGFISENFLEEVLNLPPRPLRSGKTQDGG